MEYNNEMDSIEIRFEMKQLSDSLNKLQIEKKNLLTIEKNLKSRYEMLIKNYMQGNGSSLVDSLTSFGTQQPDSLLSIIVDDNVKSSEEEMVYASMAVRPQLSPSCESNGTNMRPDSIDSISMMMSLIGDCYVPISRSEITSKRLAQFESVDNGQDNELENNEINVCDQPSPPTDTHKCDAFRTNFILRKKNDFGCR
ncbi:hypothetical protein RDWZM_005695 [Blomia tropicalis]|uniref:Uncharacterized protein n=1 Tax=Blomia tropicalis TaxID=40697 RepID=A0A9Q0M789_BLOTA|nr:hypothetical protein RDWZM_005695 [Blomia tropicalis]